MGFFGRLVDEEEVLHLHFPNTKSDRSVSTLAMMSLMSRLYALQWGDDALGRRISVRGDAGRTWNRSRVRVVYRSRLIDVLSAIGDGDGIGRIFWFVYLTMLVLALYRVFKGRAVVGGDWQRAVDVVADKIDDDLPSCERVVRLYEDPAVRASIALLVEASGGVVVADGYGSKVELVWDCKAAEGW